MLDDPQEVIELAVRVPNPVRREYIIAGLKALLAAEPDVVLENYAVFPASVYDAPEQGERMAVPA